MGFESDIPIRHGISQHSLSTNSNSTYNLATPENFYSSHDPYRCVGHI